MIWASLLRSKFFYQDSSLSEVVVVVGGWLMSPISSRSTSQTIHASRPRQGCEYFQRGVGIRSFVLPHYHWIWESTVPFHYRHQWQVRWHDKGPLGWIKILPCGPKNITICTIFICGGWRCLRPCRWYMYGYSICEAWSYPSQSSYWCEPVSTRSSPKKVGGKLGSFMYFCTASLMRPIYSS